MSNLKESIINIVRSTASFKSINKLESVIAESLDLLYHYNDIFNQRREVFNMKLSEVLFKDLVLPILAGSLIADKLKPYHISIPISLLVISHMLCILKYTGIQESLSALMFHSQIPENYYEVMNSPPNRDSPPLQKLGTLVENPVSSALFSFLSCKEDNLTGLSLNVLQSGALNCAELLLKISDSQKFIEVFTRIAGILREILLCEADFRFCTSHLASKLLVDLLKYAREDQVDVIKDTVKSALNKHSGLLASILGTTKSPMHVIRVFEEEWEFTKKIQFNGKVELPLNYILPAVDEFAISTPSECRRIVTEEDLLHNSMRMYLMHRKMRLVAMPDEVPEGFDCEFSPLHSLSTCNLKKNETYNANVGYLQGKQLVKVIIKGFGFNNTVKYVIEDSNFFILSQIQPDRNGYMVEMVVRYSKIFVQDKSEPNMIMLIIDQQEPLMISFESDHVWLEMRNKLVKKTKECKENELRLLKNFVQDTQ